MSAPGQWTGKGLVEEGVGFQLERVWQGRGTMWGSGWRSSHGF